MTKIPKIKIESITGRELAGFLKEYDLPIWLSSDEEGNDFGRLVKINGKWNISVHNDHITLYPISEYGGGDD